MKEVETVKQPQNQLRPVLKNSLALSLTIATRVMPTYSELELFIFHSRCNKKEVTTHKQTYLFIYLISNFSSSFNKYYYSIYNANVSIFATIIVKDVLNLYYTTATACFPWLVIITKDITSLTSLPKRKYAAFCDVMFCRPLVLSAAYN